MKMEKITSQEWITLLRHDYCNQSRIQITDADPIKIELTYKGRLYNVTMCHGTQC